MENSSLHNLSKIISAYNYTTRDLMTDWKDMKFDEKNKDNNFDFVPKPDNNNNLPYVLVRKKDKYFKSTSILYIPEDSHIFDVLEKMFKAFSNKYKNVRLTFLIVTKDKNNTGFINHNDFNKLAFALSLWQIFYFFEEILTNYLKAKADRHKIEDIVKNNNIYKKDKEKDTNLDPIYYMSLGHKLKLYNECEENTDPLCFKHIPNITPNVIPTANLKKFRNRIAHPVDKPRIIRQKSDIRDLHDLLNLLNYWIILPEVKAWYPHMDLHEP